MIHPTFFDRAITNLHHEMKATAKAVHTAKWQSIDISKRPEAEMRELSDVFFRVQLPSEELNYYRRQIKPNLPWADNHFEQERVSGKPINPGETWKEWPYGNSASNFLKDGVFSHTYAERYWPKNAGDPTKTNWGIRYAYGDLMDVVNLLKADPLTRQAYLPIFFPEDTGVVHGERIPCSLGYHFMMRDSRLNIFYPIRSCDFIRHFRDDLYLTTRLLLWMLAELRKLDDAWKTVVPGIFTFWAGSLHCFINDHRKL
jgi:thymidylate synthase